MFADLISELTNSDLYSSPRCGQGSVRSDSAVGWRSELRCLHQALHEARYGAPTDPTYAGFGYDSMMSWPRRRCKGWDCDEP